MVDELFFRPHVDDHRWGFHDETGEGDGADRDQSQGGNGIGDGDVVGADERVVVEELHEAEPLVHKKYGDSFEDTTLEAELAQRGIGRLVVTGAQTDACIRATLHGAFTRGYDTTLVSDAHTTEDFSAYGLPPADKVIAHTNMYWTWQAAPGRTASVVDTDGVSFEPEAARASAR